MYLEKLEQYPSEIKIMIEGLVDIYDKECSHIILYGSGAQNKLCYQWQEDKLIFSSDLEFYVIPLSRNNENNKSFNKSLMDKSHSYLKELSFVKQAPFVDVCAISQSFFSEASPRISSFELKHNGLVLKGEDLLVFMPEINEENYDQQLQNIEIVKGLKILLMNSFKYFQCGDIKTKDDKDRFYYFLSLSYLNLLRTLLPFLGYFKLSEEEREETIGNTLVRGKISSYFDNSLLDAFKVLSIDKKKSESSYQIETLFLINYKAYKSILMLLFDCSENKIYESISQNNDTIFDGTHNKKKLLGNLTSFFLIGLECLNESINDRVVTDNMLKKLKEHFDVLHEENSKCTFNEIINEYIYLEKTHWRVIGSKD